MEIDFRACLEGVSTERSCVVSVSFDVGEDSSVLSTSSRAGGLDVSTIPGCIKKTFALSPTSGNNLRTVVVDIADLKLVSLERGEVPEEAPREAIRAALKWKKDFQADAFLA